MKNYLLTQSTEYDCGPSSMLNAIRFLFEREEIEPALIRGIWMYSNDTYNAQGQKGKHGTSRACMRFMSSWFTSYGESCGFPIRAEFEEYEKANMLPDGAIMRCLKSGGVAIVHCWCEGYAHYVLLTGLTEDGVAVFDPYDEPPEVFFDYATERKRVVKDKPCQMNRVVHPDLIDEKSMADYAMGEITSRECLLIWNTRTEKKAE